MSEDYTLTTTGIQLNNGLVFQDGDHINIRIVNPDKQEVTFNMHIEAKCGNLPKPPECSDLKYHQAKLIGQNFVPYEILGMSPDAKQIGCISWVQFARSNYHYEYKECVATPPAEPPLPPTGAVDPLTAILLGGGVLLAGAVLFVKSLRKTA